MSNSTTRFSSRVENYVKYRPSYPAALIDTFKQECGLDAGSQVADVGSGTGILSELLLQSGYRVFGVEPNAAMRGAGEQRLAGYPSFTSVDGTAEATGLPDQSVALVTAGQAFHWFDQARARAEFSRILQPGGWVALIWNERRTGASLFLRDYETLLKTYGTDYETSRHTHLAEEVIAAFFAPGSYRLASFENQQLFDYAGLEGRLCSSSYTPEPGDPRYQPMLARLRRIFETRQHNGLVAFDYDTLMYYGQLAPDEGSIRSRGRVKVVQGG